MGASKRAAGAPSPVPKKNEPRYPAALPWSSVMVVSLFLPEAVDERLHAFLDPGRHADDLPGACQAAQHSHEPREPVGDALDLLGHGTDALELPTRLGAVARSAEHTSELQSRPHL